MITLIAVGAIMVVVRMDWPSWLELVGMTIVGLGCGGWVAARARRAGEQARTRSGGESRDGS